MNKRDRPEIPEMGGLGIIAGFSLGILAILGLMTFGDFFREARMELLLAVLCSVLLLALIGVIDDILDMRQWVKALLPMLSALPLAAVRAGQTALWIPFIGVVDFRIFYSLVLVPLGVTGAANATNMLAGFNGLEVGVGLVAMGSLTIIGLHRGEMTAVLILVCGIGALAGALFFNWYPARMFVGDVGTLAIGGIVASACIVGNFESAGIILFIPHFVDFGIKAMTGFQKSFGVPGEDGRLLCPGRPRGLGQALLAMFGGLHERTLTLLLIGLEALCGLGAVALHLWR